MSEEDTDVLSMNVTVLFINIMNSKISQFAPHSNRICVDSLAQFDSKSMPAPNVIIFDRVQKGIIDEIRKDDRLVMVPIIIISDVFDDVAQIESISNVPRLIVCNTINAFTAKFEKRIKSLVERKNPILAARTGIVIKYTIFIINNSVGKQLTRTMLAEKAGVAEDYLTRIFHQEIGMTLWDYINTYRMSFAVKLLLQTDDTVYEVAEKAGFPDATYFNRVFRNQYGVSPGKLRKTGLPSA
jgi:AraC-like DNA-binding protein